MNLFYHLLLIFYQVFLYIINNLFNNTQCPLWRIVQNCDQFSSLQCILKVYLRSKSRIPTKAKLLGRRKYTKLCKIPAWTTCVNVASRAQFVASRAQFHHLRDAFSQKDHERAKKTLKLSVFYALLGFACVTAACRTLMKLTQDQQILFNNSVKNYKTTYNGCNIYGNGCNIYGW